LTASIIVSLNRQVTQLQVGLDIVERLGTGSFDSYVPGKYRQLISLASEAMRLFAAGMGEDHLLNAVSMHNPTTPTKQKIKTAP